jgi:site-specific DNA recombinase
MRLRPAKSQHAAVETKRCAIYTRKSTSIGLEQEFNSLDAQRDACLSYIKRQPGWQALETSYDDGGFTGANIDRPAFQRLLGDVDAGRIDIVVVYKVDRLSRSLLDFAKVMERFNAAGASFVSVTQNFSTADAMGRLTLNMLMSFAEFEREMISERTRDKIAGARRKGKWTGGTVPLGYSVVDKKLVVNELEAVLVREIFALYLEHRSALAVVRILNERQHVTKQHRAMNGRLRRSRAWVTSDVLRILNNPVYAGYMMVGGELFDSEHTALIDRSVFRRTQVLLEGNTVARRKGRRNPEYLLRGVLQCARCGHAFTTASTIKGGLTHRYYRCVTRDKRGKQACPSAPLPAGSIETYVVDRLREAVARGNLAGDVTAAVQARIVESRRNLATERKELSARIAALSAELQRDTESLANLTGPARRPIEARMQDAGGQLGHCEARLAVVERELAHLEDIEIEGAWVAETLTDFHRVWDLLTPENRARLLRLVVQRVEVDEPANEVRVFLVDLGSAVPIAGAATEATPEAGA